MGKIGNLLDKLSYALSLLDSNELLLLFFALAAYHFFLFIFISLGVRGSLALRIRSLQSERDEYRRNWEHRDTAWRDREEELRRIFQLEREREISQLKAEYDSTVHLLEQKLKRVRTREV